MSPTAPPASRPTPRASHAGAADPWALRPSSLHASRRASELEALEGGEVVDVLVVGGGVTGASVALDAVTRGLSVALVERGDLAQGTSRWSSKLVHGGLRYLAHGNVRLALESARERHLLLTRTAPHLVRPRAQVMPHLPEHTASDLAQLAGALLVGDALRRAAGTPPTVLPRPRRLDAEAALRDLPALERAQVRGATRLWDGHAVDDARLVIALARTAAAFGAKVLTHTEATALDGHGAHLVDRHGGGSATVRARHVVNATGVWADRLDERVALRPSRGSHVLVPAERLGHPEAVLMVAAPERGGRWVFAIPDDEGLVHIGLTDVGVEEPTDPPEPSDEEIAYLLEVISGPLAEPLTTDDVVGSYAGLRPLLAPREATDGAEEGVGSRWRPPWMRAPSSTADLSRDHRIVDGRDGVLTIVGGKLTTARRMGADVVDRIAARPGVAAGPCVTHRQPLVGAAPPHRLAALDAAPRLVARYGNEAPRVAALAEAEPALAEPVSPRGVLGAELLFGVRHEGALDEADLLDRRTRLGLVADERARAHAAAQLALARAR